MKTKMIKLMLFLTMSIVMISTAKVASAKTITSDMAEEYLKLMTCYDSVKEFEEGNGLTDEDVVEILQALMEHGYSEDLIKDICSNLDLDDYFVVEVKSNNIADYQIEGITDKAYTGKNITLSITIKNGKTTLKKSKDYTVSYKNNKSIGTATVTIKGKGSYKGTVTKKFKILPTKTELSSLKLKTSSNKVAFQWAKNKTATGYQIYYATAKAGDYSTLKTITDQNTTTYTSKSLTAGTTYYFMIKAYKTVGSKKYYSIASEAKKIAILSANGEVSVDIYDGNSDIDEPHMLVADELKKDVMLCWKNFADCDSVEIIRTDSENMVYTVIAKLSSGQDMYIDQGAAGKGYSYTVRSVKGTENSLVGHTIQATSNDNKWYLGKYGYLRAEVENGEVMEFKQYSLDGSLEFTCDWYFVKLYDPISGNEVDASGNVVYVDRAFTYEISASDGNGYYASEYITYSEDKFIETSTITYQEKTVFNDVVFDRYY